MGNFYTDGHEVLFAKNSDAVRDWIVYQYGGSALEDEPYQELSSWDELTFEETFSDYADHWETWVTNNMSNLGMSLDNLAIPCILIAERPNVLDDPDADFPFFPRLTTIGRRLVGVPDGDDDGVMF